MSTFPTCQICQQQFSHSGPTPFLLPCLHPVCETCVTSADGGVVHCRPCERDVNLTETPLQKDVVREREILTITVHHHPELVLCTHEEDGNQAVCWCKECEAFLCEHCQMVHNSFKGTKRHSVQDIGELQPGPLEEELYCKTHPKYILDTWDESCCILTCGKCRLDEHSQHKAVKIEHAAEIVRREVANLQKDAESAVDKHAAQIAAAENDLQSADEKYTMIPDQIGHTLCSLKTVIDQREKELQIELQQHKEMARDDLDKKKQTSETCYKRCQITSEYIIKVLQYSSDHDIMSLKPILQSKTEDNTSSAQARFLESDSVPGFNTDGLEKIKSTLSGFGTIASNSFQMVEKLTKESGTQTENQESRENEDLKEELEKMRKENQTLRENLTRQKTDKETGIYRLMADVNDAAFLLNCSRVELSKTKHNAKMVHINAKDELINEPHPYPPHSDQRLKKYEGTSSTVPLPQCGSPQYFEVESQVGIEKTLTGNTLLLQIGLVREEEQDQSHSIDGQPNSYSLNVLHCPTHNSICRMVLRHGKYLTCLSDTLENTPDTSATLHYGVVYDSARSRIAFLDVKNEKIICRVRNIISSLTLWPMFGVFNPQEGVVSMSLVTGSDIEMTEWKKALILKSLS